MDSEQDASTEQVGVENLLSSFLSQSSVNGHESSANTSYHPYPPSRPFLNSDFQRSSDRPATAFPESNRDGVMSALRSLQEKMRRLEVEQQDAGTNTVQDQTAPHTSSLHTHASHQHVDSFRPARQSLHTDQEDGHVSSGLINSRAKSRELESQLSTAEMRCQLLEKQLEYMRRMVQTAERDRVEAVQKADVLQQQHHTPHSSPPTFTPDYCAQLERIGELERDHLRLTATQTLAESKIRELENKLKEERDHRRLLQDRALDLESAAVSHQILLNSAPVSEKEAASAKNKGKKPPASKKRKKLVSRKQIPVKSEPTKHFRLNLADIPFVAGKSTGPSHAVGANVQKVLALMKSHNLALCSSLYNGHSHGGQGTRSSSPSLSSSSGNSVDQSLCDLLAQLQDEFGQLSCEHQELLHQIHEERDPQMQEDIEKELDQILHKMEVKGEQISKVRQHQEKLEEQKQETKKSSRRNDPVPRPSSAMGRIQASHRHFSRGDHRAGGQGRPRSSSRNEREHCYQDLAHPSLSMLKDMRKLQCTLRRDDLCWE